MVDRQGNVSKSTRGRPARGLYEFEGEQVSVNSLKSRGMVYRAEAIRDALRAGCTTMPALLAHIETSVASSRAARRKGASVPFYGRGKDDARET